MKDYKKIVLKNGEIRYRKTISLGYHADGRRKQKQLTAKTVKELRQMESQYKLGLKKVSPSLSMTVGEAIDLYFADIQKTLSAITIQNRRHFFYGVMNIMSNVQLTKVEEYQLNEIISHRLSKVSKTTVVKDVALMKAFFSWCVRKHLISESPARYIRPPKSDTKERPYLKEDEMWKLFSNVKNDKYRLAFMVVCFTGLRKEELCGLSIDDLYDHELHLSHTVRMISGKGTIVSTEFKNASSKRIVPIPLWLEYDLSKFLKTDKYPFKCMYNHMAMYLHEACENKKIVVHDLRHSYASMLIAKGVDIYTLSKLMGHASITTTANIYGHLYDESRRKVANLL